MKKTIFAFAAFIMMCACSGEREYLTYRGLSMALPFQQFVDSLAKQGFEKDTAHSDDAVWRFTHPKETFTLSVAQHNDTLDIIEEYYVASYNDSTRQLWQELRDAYAKELDCMPGCPVLYDDHKEAMFDTPKGHVNIILQNRNIPTLTLHLDKEVRE